VAIKISETGLQTMLSSFLSSEAMLLKLYTSDVTPTSTTALSTLVEASGNGYAEVSLSGTSNWNITAGTATLTAPVTWTFTGAVGDVYGYYIVGASTGNLIAAEKFATGPYTVATNGDKITVSITITVA